MSDIIKIVPYVPLTERERHPAHQTMFRGLIAPVFQGILEEQRDSLGDWNVTIPPSADGALVHVEPLGRFELKQAELFEGGAEIGGAQRELALTTKSAPGKRRRRSARTISDEAERPKGSGRATPFGMSEPLNTACQPWVFLQRVMMVMSVFCVCDQDYTATGHFVKSRLLTEALT